MNLVHVFKRIGDVLWELGGISASADLSIEHFSDDWGTASPVLARVESAPLEGDPCRSGCPRI